MGEGIAIVGMACRYPDARTPGELWENVLARRRAFRQVPPERLNLSDYVTGDPTDPDSLYPIEAALLEGWEFDRVRFKVAGRTFRSTDHAHWLALEVAAQALADAGFPDAEGLPRDATGVLLGNTLTGEFSRANTLRLRWPYVRRVLGGILAGTLADGGWEEGRIDELLGRVETAYKAPFPAPMEESLAGGLSNTIAGRICNHFDLHGGGYTLDGACAASLLAVSNACSALAAGDLDAALAGGVDLSLDPFELVGFARVGALAPGEMRVFDARSSGFLPGEGCGFVVLMREGDAARLGCRTYAVIRGWGVSSDGHGGISRPESEGQKMALARAYRRAGFGMETVGYFEGHGTGTSVGDAAELAALSSARREAGSGQPSMPAALGSIKANIGHTKAAAGVAGLIKAALAVHSQVLPPTTGFEEPHAELQGENASLRLLTQGEPWPADLPLRAAVSAMGFGGINTHVVLEGDAAARRRSLTVRERELLASWQDAELLLLAAADAAALADEAERLAGIAARLSRSELTDLAAELARRLGPGSARAAVVAAKPAEAAERLRRLAEGLREGATPRLDTRHGIFFGTGSRSRRIGFLFPGQGAPSHLDGGAWRRRFEDLEAVYEPAGLDPKADAAAAIHTAVAQPAILSHSLAGLRLLERLGLRAAVAAGHSLGEIAALHWAGALDAAAALRLAKVRGRAMADAGGDDGEGAMASLGADPATVAELLGNGEAVIAAYNSPRRTVISGPAAAVDAAVERARDRGLEASRLRVSHAFHSPLMEPAAPRLAAELEATPFRPPVRPVASTVTGGLLDPQADLRSLLRGQLTEPVRFTEALAAVSDRADLWIEVGPGRALSELAGELLDTPVISLDAGGPSLTGLLKAAGAAFALGAPLDAAFLFEGRFTRPFDLGRPLRFLGNPCETAPVRGAAPKSLETRPVPVDFAEETAPALAALPAPGNSSVRDLVRQLVAERAELPPASVADDSRLLSDLHLNSISVGQLVVEASRRLGLRPPAAPTDYARATVAEVAQALEEQAPSGSASEAPGAPAGVGSWVRPFTVKLIPRTLRALPRLSSPQTDERDWRVIAPPGISLAKKLPRLLEGAGVALCLPPEPDERHAALFVEAARAVLAGPKPVRFALIQQGGDSGGGFARTLHLEVPDAITTVIDLPLDHPDAASWVAAEVAAGSGYTEAHYDENGTRRVPVLRLLSSGGPGPLPIGPDDILLVTGGGKGIAAECALDLARAAGARLALLGRSRPEDDAELAANTERMAAAGISVLYVPADVTEAAAVAAAVARVEAELGPVTAVLHGAGANAPRLLSAIDEEGFLRAAGPKIAGLRNVLAAVDRDRLRLLVTFGSIIARTGLRGEAEYAVANARLARATERFAREHPGCRCLALEWSVWAGVGMGERLGTLESLMAQGISPIPPETGVAMLRDLISQSLPAVSIVATGRFGEPPTLEVERPELPLLRYLETPRVHVPGVELVVDAEVSADTDPHLADHVFRGEPLFAAVLGMEAMAQVAMALVGTDEIPAFENAVFERPVAVPPGRSTTIRVAALVRAPGEVEVVLRDASTGFAADHFRAVCRFGAPVDSEPRLLAPFAASITEIASPADVRRIRLDPEGDLYSGILFHRGRFRRVRGYRSLRATECLAEIAPDGTTAWFGRYLPDRLVLGDPGARDAAIHGIQACIPHATLLPIGVERVTSHGLENDAPLLLAARERSRHGDEFVYDLEVLTLGGCLRERWEGLRLRAVDRTVLPEAWTAALLGPYVERRLQEILPGSGVRVTMEQEAVPRRHRPDGKPEPLDGSCLAVSHAGSLTFSVAGDGGRLGCDLEPVAERTEEVWQGLLGNERYRLAELIARERGETLGAAATRVWAAAESLTKAGVPHGAPLVLDRIGDDGWLLLRSGELRIGTFLAPVRELAGPAALAVLVDRTESVH
ncbi:MAG TPA: SDR family NAD(P)-dependent oxidoreductase [Thermoanaerobaculia bacterium]|jgi:enediyne polyketide synthase|nr:SDR family NAD(P)-dependent oxidoreductase [Thermoanaerobaculia bacterium]